MIPQRILDCTSTTLVKGLALEHTGDFSDLFKKKLQLHRL